MKTNLTKNLRPTRIVLLLGAIGLATHAVHAQQAEATDARGKMLDNSKTLPLQQPSSGERESKDFAGLPPSSLNLAERKTMLEAQAPQTPAKQAMTIEDKLDGANFESGKAELLPKAKQTLDGIAARLKGRTNIRFQIAGHTDNQHIAAYLRPTFKDNQALSEARALAVAGYLKQALALSAEAFAVSGFGDTMPIAGNDTPEGMAQNRRTTIRVWFDEEVAAVPAPAAPPKQVEAIVSRDACAPVAAKSGLPFSISVDGQPLNVDTNQTEADRQRCVDVALEQAAIQIKYDPMNVSPALNAWVLPNGAIRGNPVEFRTYTNYAWWLRRAEVRVFVKGQNTHETPLALVPVAIGGTAQWTPPQASTADLGYVLRVYDERGRFDETALKPLHLLERYDPASEQERSKRDELTGWGETSLALKNIPAGGGTVTVSGERIKAGQTVTAMGIAVPVDANGKFAMRQILPAGAHSVDVAVKDEKGVGAVFRRNLTIADKDWFYVAQADLTIGHDHTSGPAQLVTNDTTHYNNSTWADGRGAFFLKGKLGDDYRLTASADSGEQPLKDLFSNFQSKDPYYLLRNINPDQYYPVYGDDSAIVDGAPTQGKFYVKVEKGNSYAMWGNFQTSWTGTELTQYTRGLYGANLVWQSDGTTSFGEKSTTLNVFAAEPGTLQSREEFRGTGGSQYYLHRQDLTQGSEQLWVEIRDADSGLVLQRSALTPIQDYSIDYMQGRVSLRAPLPSVADGSTLVQSSGLNGNPVYLVTTYEYVPGLTAVNGSDVGLRASHWFNDSVRVGTSIYHQGETGAEQTLKGVDATLRYAPGTWVKAEVAQSSGIGSENLSSVSGGFDFNQNNGTGQTALAKRLDVGMNLTELAPDMKGHLSAYWQDQDAGFSGPGLVTPNSEALRQAGVAAVVPLGDRTEVALKADDRNSISQTADSTELALRQKIDPEWGVSIGLRHDNRNNDGTAGTVVNASPILNQIGSRNDMIVRVDFQPLKDGQSGQAGASDLAPAKPAPNTAAVANLPIAAPGAGAPGTGPASSLLPGAATTGPTASTTPATGAPRLQPTPAAAAGVAASHIAGLQYESWDLYGYVQDTLARSGDRSENNRVGLGGDWQASDKLKLTLEGSGGSGGPGGRLAGDYQVDDRSDVYLSYTMESESQDLNYSGREGTLASGTHYKLNDQVGLFGETRWVDGAGPQSLTHAFGVDLAPNKLWNIGLKFEDGTLSDPLAGDVKRDAVALTAAYKFEKLKFTTALEYRVDDTVSLGTVTGSCSTPAASGCSNGASTGNMHTWLTRNTLGYQLDPSWRLLGKLNLSHSSSSGGAFYDGDYTEVVMSAAYRPVDNDRWNTLFKYTYFYNLPSTGQIDAVTGSAIGYSQRSHVLDVDTIYDVRPWISVGAKLGVRVGQLQTTATPGVAASDWFSSSAYLVVLRADLHFVKEWDALVEARRLAALEAGDARSGFLVGVYRHVNEHVKIGVGYNFTNFSDDLTDQSYRSSGWFMNALSTF